MTVRTMEPAAPALLRQPVGVWGIAFACAVSFMGIGLVDPILPSISRQLGADPGQTLLLFTSYLFITGLTVFFTQWLATRIGAKKALLIGVVVVVVFATATALSGTVDAVIAFRAAWGVGNALFAATALTAMVASSPGGTRHAVILYEAALGIGLAVGPLVGGLLGGISWRGPFFGVAALMTIGLAVVALLVPQTPPPPREQRIAATAAFRALARPALLTLVVTALFYMFAFFITLAYSPYPIEAAASAAGLDFGAIQLGLVFFAWGVAVALTSIVAAPRLSRRFGTLRVLVSALVLMTVVLVAFVLVAHSLPGLIVTLTVGGLVSGVMNTVLTEAVMEATDLPRGVTSSAYTGVRFMGGAFAPAVAGALGSAFGPEAAYGLAVVAAVAALLTLAIGHRALRALAHRPHETAVGEAEAIGLGDEL